MSIDAQQPPKGAGARERPLSQPRPKVKVQLTNIFLVSLMRFLIDYRRTALGPLWTILGPLLFVTLVGGLYASIMKADENYFIPHLTIGFIVWSLINMMLTQSLTLFQRGRAQVLQNRDGTTFLVYENVVGCLIVFLHQMIVILLVVIYYQIGVTWHWLFSLLGILVICLNGIWVGHGLGILGARYRDLSEMANSILRLAFLATPIIWVPSSDHTRFASQFLIWNPFYHYIEIVRAPILNHEVPLVSWAVVLGITFAGFAVAILFKSRYGRFVPLWV